MGVAAPHTPKGLGSQRITEKLAHRVELLGKLLDRNHVVKFSG